MMLHILKRHRGNGDWKGLEITPGEKNKITWDKKMKSIGTRKQRFLRLRQGAGLFGAKGCVGLARVCAAVWV